MHPEQLAYVLYTSGSYWASPRESRSGTARFSNFLMSMRETPGLCEHDTLLAVTPLSFDIAGLELFLPLITGAQIVLATEAQARDGHALKRLLEIYPITVMQATPASWRLLLAGGWAGAGAQGLKALCGGEALQAELAAQLQARRVQLWNMCGPTETTVWSSTRAVALSARSDDAPPASTPPAAGHCRHRSNDSPCA